MKTNFVNLTAAAKSFVGEFRSDGCITAGGVGAAILSESGKIYTGVCVDAACGIGFCAEHAAIAEMLKNRETRIVACVAVGKGGKPMPPCGRCRDLMHQLSPFNLDAEIMIGPDEITTLRELLPHAWDYTE